MNKRVFLLHRDDLGAGQARRIVAAPDCRIALYNLDGCFYATQDNCTHGTASLARGEMLEGGLVACPVHDGLFHIPTGKAMGAPCTVDLKTFPVIEEGGEIYVELAHEALPASTAA